MTNEHEFDLQASYRIIVIGVLDPSWSDRFDGFSISAQADRTIVNGIAADQSVLHGILAKINDLGVSIITVSKLFHEP